MKSKQSVLFRIIALALSVILLVSIIPTTAFADDDQTAPIVNDPDNSTNSPSEPPYENQVLPVVVSESEDATDPLDTPPAEDPSELPLEPEYNDPPAWNLTGDLEPSEVKAEVSLYDSSDKPISENSYTQEIDHITIKVPKTSVNTIAGFDEESLSDYISAGFVTSTDFSETSDVDSLGWVDTDTQNPYITYEASGDYYLVTLDVAAYLQNNNLSFSDFEGDVVAFASVDNTVVVSAQATIDVTEPVLTVEDIPATWQDKITVNLSTSDNCGISSVYYMKGDQMVSLGSDADSYSFDITEMAAADVYVIYSEDKAGNKKSVSLGKVMVDTQAPQITLVSYSNTDLQGKQSWSNGSQTISVTLQITDSESEINQTAFKLNDQPCEPASVNGDQYTFILSDADHIRAESVKITAYDNAGRHTDYNTKALAIDTADPQASDIEAVIDEVETNKILNILTFGLYHNDDLRLTVKASDNGGAPITRIRLFNKDEEIEADNESLTVDGGSYSQVFILGTSEKQFELYLTVTDGVGRESSKISIFDISQLSSRDQDLKSKLTDGVYELVATKLVPEASWEISGEKFAKNGEHTVYSEAVNVTLTLSDPLSGISEVTYYFSTSDKFTENDNGTYTIDGSVSALTVPVEYTYGTGALKDKKLTATIHYTAPATAASGAYTLLAKVINNSKSECFYANQVYIDNSAPTVGTPTFNDTWSKQPIRVTFSVADVPEISSGILSVQVADKNAVALDQSKIIDNQDGSYSFDAEQNTEYSITATDRLGHTSPAVKVTINKYDTGAPSVEITGYSNKTSPESAQAWSQQPVTISFTAADPAAAEGGTAVSGIGSITYTDPENNTNTLTPEDGGVYSFEASKRGVYKITVTDNAGNPTTIETEEILFDNNDPEIVKIVFREASAQDVRTFGLYKNSTVIADVYVKSVGGAPITGIDIKNNDVSLYTTGGFTDGVTAVAGEADLYQKSFAIPESESAYQLVISAITQTGKTKSAEKFSDIDVYLENQQLLDLNKELFEVVITMALPIIGNFSVTGMQCEADAGGAADALYSGNSGTLAVTLQDDLAGIDKASLAVTLDGAAIADNKLDYEFDNEHKVTQLTVQYALENTEENPLASGLHTFKVAVKNLAGVLNEKAFDFYVDNTAPVISGITYDGKDAMEKWTSSTVVIGFTADDTMGGLPYGGLADATFEVVGSQNGFSYTVQPVGQASENKYAFTADLHQDYSVSVKDVFGNESAAFVVPAADVLIDTEAPHVGNVLYNGKMNSEEVEVTASGVEVSFFVHDKSSYGEWLSGLKNDQPDFVIEITAMKDGAIVPTVDPIDLSYEYSAENDFYTYKFVSSKNYTYHIKVKDPAGNSNELTTDRTYCDETDPVITGYKIEKNAADTLLSILSFGAYYNDEIILTIYAEDVDPSAGIAEITAVYDGVQLTGQGDLVCSYDSIAKRYEAHMSFALPISESAYNPELLVATVTDNLGHSSSDNLSSENVPNENKDGNEDPIIGKPFEIVSTKEPVTIGDITVEYQQGSVENPDENKVNVYSADINKMQESADGKYTVGIDDVLSGIKADTVKVYFDLADKFVEKDGVATPNGAAKIEAAAELDLNKYTIKYTKDATLTEKIIGADIDYLTPSSLATGRYIFLVEATNNSGNPISKYAAIYLDNTDPAFVGDFTYSNADEAGVQQWMNQKVAVGFTVTDDPDAFGYCGGIANIEVVGKENKQSYTLVKDAVTAEEDTIAREQKTYTFLADLYQAYTVTVTDAFGRTKTATTDFVLYDNESAKISNFTYDGTTAAEAAWQNKDTGMVVTFDVSERSDEEAIRGIWLSGMSKENNVDTLTSNLTVTVKGSTDGKNYAAECTYNTARGVFTYSFTSRSYQTYEVKIVDPAGNSSDATSEETKVDIDAPYVVDYQVGTVEQNKVLNILTFGIYSNSAFVLSVEAEDPSPACGIQDIIATYDGTVLEVYEALAVSDADRTGLDASASTATKSFVIPVSEEAYDPAKLDIQVIDRVGNSSSRNLDALNADDDVTKYDETVKSPFEVVSNKKPATINDITVEYQLGSVENPGANMVDVYSADIYKTSESADGRYKVTIDDTLSGIDSATVKVYFDLADKFVEKDGVATPNGASEVQVNNSDFIQLNSYTIRYTKDGTLKDKIVAADIEYLTPSSLATGRYIFLVEATNNSGNPISKYAAIYLDNTDPAFVGDFTYSNVDETGAQQWTNQKVTVGFTVTDDPDGYDYYGGVADITVVGNANKQTYLLKESAIKRVKDTYTFDADLYQTYTVTVTDAFGRTKTATTDFVLYDNESAKISNFTYDGRSKASSAEWENESTGMVVTFDVDDRSDESAISGIWLSGMSKENNTDTFNSNLTVKVTGEKDKLDYSDDLEVRYNEAKKVFTYEFTSHLYQTYKVEIVDPAGNSSDATSAETKVDTAIPEITNVSFRKEESTASKILNFLTFGLYSDMKIVMTVEITDQAASSGIDEIHVFYEGNELTAYGEGEIKDGTPENIGDGVKATREFLIEDQVLDARKIIISATDHVGYAAVEKSLHKLNQENKVESKENGIGITQFDASDDSFEIVSSKEKVACGEIEYTGNKGTATYTADDGNGGKIYYFSGHITVSFKVDAPESKLHNIGVILNNNIITKWCKFYTDNPNDLKPLPDYFTYYNDSTKTSEKLDQITVVFDTDYVESQAKNDPDFKGGVLRRMSALDPLQNPNEIRVYGETNNGNNISKLNEKFFILDNVAPTITKFSFDSTVSEEADKHFDEDVNVDENKATQFRDAENNVILTSYGYYFRYDTKVTVGAFDFGTNSNAGSGVKEIRFFGESNEQLDSVSFAEIGLAPNDNGEAEFIVPAGFKGKVYAYAIDNVDNIGDIVTPDGLIVESADQHTRASDAAIKVNTEPVGKDPQGHPLFNGPVSVTMEVSDTYSGIERIVYAITDYNDNTTEYEAVIGNDGSVVSDADGNSAWEIVDTEKNLATRLVKTIVISPENYNCNNIRVSLKAYDRAGYPIVVAADMEPIFSIDTTKPEITVEYNPEVATHSFNGMNYFNVNRTATITVYERNFDPNDFKINTITAIEGTVPVLVPTEAWTSYTDFSNDRVEHRATVTFDTDGKFWVQLDYTDLATNSADHYGPASQVSNSRDIFCIDKTAPTVALSLSSAAMPSNRNYYSRTVVADIAVTEHNFDPSYVVTFAPDFYDSTNVTAITGPDIVWNTSSSGDVHHGTITFTEKEYDGKFAYRFRYRDLANNDSAEAVQNTFYVDSDTENPAITEVLDSTAYDGDVSPRVELSDPNFDSDNYTITVTKYKYDVNTLKFIEEVYSNKDGENTLAQLGTFEPKSNENGDTGVIFYFNDIEKTDENDGVYIIRSSYKDMAGNESQQATRTFSVNRFGAVFIPGNEATKQLIDGYYSNNPKDVVIQEINVNELSSYDITLTYNSGSVTLKDGDFSIDKQHNGNEWYIYTFTIKADVFDREGEYFVTVTSVDEFGNTVSNRTAEDTETVQRTCPVMFKVDKTAPEISITGVVDGQDYSEDARDVHIVCVDENLDKSTLKVVLNDRELTLDQLRDEFGAEIDDTMMGELDVNFTVQSGGEEIVRTLKVTISDLAANVGESDNIQFTLSATFWTLYFHSPLALILTGVGLLALIALAAFLIVRRKRKNAAA